MVGLFFFFSFPLPIRLFCFFLLVRERNPARLLEKQTAHLGLPVTATSSFRERARAESSRLSLPSSVGKSAQGVTMLTAYKYLQGNVKELFSALQRAGMRNSSCASGIKALLATRTTSDYLKEGRREGFPLGRRWDRLGACQALQALANLKAISCAGPRNS